LNKRIFVARILLGTWLVFLSYAMLMPPGGKPIFDFLSWPGMDKLIHVISFGLLGLLSGASSKPRPRLLAIVFIIWSGYGLAIEIIQSFIPGRSFEALDLVADMVGTILGYLIFSQLRGIKGG